MRTQRLPRKKVLNPRLHTKTSALFSKVFLIVVSIIIIAVVSIYSHLTSTQHMQNAIYYSSSDSKGINDEDIQMQIINEELSQDLNDKKNVKNSEKYPKNIDEISDYDTNNFYHYLSRQSYGFALDKNKYLIMNKIIKLYSEYANKYIEHDSTTDGPLKGKYIILTPAAQMCNRLRSHMGAIYLGILTKRIVFIDIGTDRYAARLDGVFKNHGFTWEYNKIPSSLRSKLSSSKTQSFSVPYETSTSSGGHVNVVCKDYLSDNSNVLYKINSHAAWLPLISRNYNLQKSVVSNSQIVNNEILSQNEDFSKLLVEHFPTVLKEYDNLKTQENYEILEVSLARNLYIPEDDIQSNVDELINQAYSKARKYYSSHNIEIGPDEIPLVVGIHMRTEYLMTMALPKAKKGLEALDDFYKWFTDCGNLIVPLKYHNVPYFIFFAGDTPKSQKFAEKVFGSDRILYQPFIRTGKTLEGIKDAIIDLITVSSFDHFISTPHSSYSEMASLLGQPRRLHNNEFIKEVTYDMNGNNYDNWINMAWNRPILPMMTFIEWEYNKLNKYLYGRAIDINLNNGRDINSNKLFPLTANIKNSINYKNDKICKLQIHTGMGWMGVFDMYKNLKCYNKDFHHPGSWFPIAG